MPKLGNEDTKKVVGMRGFRLENDWVAKSERMPFWGLAFLGGAVREGAVGLRRIRNEFALPVQFGLTKYHGVQISEL